MKRKLLIGLLGLGTFAGFGHGFASLRHHHNRRAHFERHVAQVCIEAARSLDRPNARNERPSITGVDVRIR